jgi:hypothetical protein
VSTKTADLTTAKLLFNQLRRIHPQCTFHDR